MSDTMTHDNLSPDIRRAITHEADAPDTPQNIDAKLADITARITAQEVTVLRLRRAFETASAVARQAEVRYALYYSALKDMRGERENLEATKAMYIYQESPE